MRLPLHDHFAVRRDATVPTTVVVVTQIAAPTANTATSTSMATVEPTITVLKTITAGSGAGNIVTSTLSGAQIPVASSSPTPNIVTSSLGGSSIISTLSTSQTASPSSQTGTTGLASATPISSLLSSSSMSSTRLGLAIGIPIAVVSIFGLVVFMLILLRKRMDPKPTETLAFKAKKPVLPKTTSEKHSISSVYSSSDMEQGYDPEYEKRVLPVTTEDAPKPTFLKRISRLMNVPESPLEFKSPLFLRRFNLSSNKYVSETGETHEKELPKSPESALAEAVPTRAKKVAFPENEVESKSNVGESTYMVVKPYSRRLGDELTVCVGEKVSIVDQHSDGWATVKSLDSSNTGVIPLMCIKKFMNK